MKQFLITLISMLLPLLGTIFGLQCINSHCRVGCQSNRGMDYMGNAHRTVYGDECLNWRSPAILENHGWEDGTYDHNYCRNPTRRPTHNYKQEEGVWCYTGLGNTKALCDVPWCLESGQSLNSTVVEKESIPAIVTATIILGIVSFFVTVVICLIVGSLCCGNKLEKSNSIELESQQDSGFVSSAR